MASNLLALIDDIASILDDVALLFKVAVKKTAGVLGDDLALNAQQIFRHSPAQPLRHSGVSAQRHCHCHCHEVGALVLLAVTLAQRIWSRF